MTTDHPGVLRRSLFQLGDWHIVKSAFSSSDSLECYAVHTNCSSASVLSPSRTTNICWRCGDDVPDELQGLITMFHWEMYSE